MTQTLRQILAHNVRTARRSQGLNQAELAHAARTSTDMVSRIERAKTGTSLEKIEAIAEALGIPPASLFGGEPPPKSDGPRGQALQKLESIIAQATDDQVRLIQRLAAAVRERREE